MKLSNHIANRFLHDRTLWAEMVEHIGKELVSVLVHGTEHEKEVAKQALVQTTHDIRPDGTLKYLVTETVTDKLNLISLKRPYNYSFFSFIEDGKRTFVLPDNVVVRIVKRGSDLSFIYITYDTKLGQMNWHRWYVDMETNICSINKNDAITLKGDVYYMGQHSSEVDKAEDHCYRLLCFVYLSDIEETLLKAKAKVGTRKSGKVLNDTPSDFVIINSNWNITSIRTEGFGVKGHFALRKVGTGRSETRIVWIDPYEKHGYVRKAKKQAN